MRLRIAVPVVADRQRSVNPIYYVCFSTATIVASLILFQGFDTTDATNTVSLIAGFLTTFLGVHLLNHSRAPEPPRGDASAAPLGNGVFHPRLSLSLESPRVASGGHGRRSSIYRVFDADEEGEEVGLRTLREEEEEEDDADERTRLARARESDLEAARASPRSR